MRQNELTWSDGKVLFSCGSPFDPGDLQGQDLRAASGQQFVRVPGIGLGTIRPVQNHGSVLSAAHTCADMVTEDDLARNGSLYPSLTRVRDFSPRYREHHQTRAGDRAGSD